MRLRRLHQARPIGVISSRSPDTTACDCGPAPTRPEVALGASEHEQCARERASVTDRLSINQSFRPRAREQLLPTLVWYRPCSFGPSSAPPPSPGHGSVHPKLPDRLCEMQNGEVPRMTLEAPTASVLRDTPLPRRYRLRTPIRPRQARNIRRDGELGGNARTLIETLHREPSLDGRYSNIRASTVTHGPETGGAPGRAVGRISRHRLPDRQTGRVEVLRSRLPRIPCKVPDGLVHP